MANATTTALKRVIRSMVKAEPTETTDRELLRQFAADGDQRAFAALVARHGGMVLGVCRRSLPTVQDAEDACQATFLLLARKANSVRWQSSIANYLYATARKVAHNARVAAQRRQRREARAAVPEFSHAVDRMTGRELLAALDEELDRLPARYREPLVLCYLEGLTGDEAAVRLGVPAATVRTRLNRGRKKLHDALTKGSCALGAGLLALAVSSPAGASPPRLVNAILATVTGFPPDAVAELVKGVAVKETVNKSLFVLAALIGVVAVGVGLGSLHSKAEGQPPDKPKPAATPGQAKDKDAKADPETPQEVTYSGRVLDPDDKPVAGAKLYALYYTPKELPIPERAVSDKDGGFRFTIATKDLDRSASPKPWDEMVVVAAAEGYGLGVPAFQAGKKAAHTDLVLRLAKDDVPLTGRVLDLQGQPVAHAKVLVQGLYSPIKGNDLTAWLTQLTEKKEGYPALRDHLFGLEGMWMGRDVGSVVTPVVTDAEGRFRLKGVGRERVVALRIEGPTIVVSQLWAMTRPGDKFRVSSWRRGEGGEEMTFVGTNFDHVATPCRPIIGVVRDKDTGKPIPGAVVESYMFAGTSISGRALTRTVADREGRYRLLGMPKAPGNQIRAAPLDDQPYLMALANVPDGPGLEPVTVDFSMKRGVWITGKVTDKVTGKPVHSQIRYAVLDDNPNRSEVPGLTFSDYMQTRADDGSFRFVGLPGRGAVAAQTWTRGYIFDVGADKIAGLKDANLVQPFNAVAEVNPDQKADSVTCDLVLDPGRKLTGTILGPDDKPLTGVLIRGLREYGDWEHAPATTADFTVIGLKPGESRLLQFSHAEKKLAGSLVIRSDEKGPLTVKLGPAGVLTGRFVTTDGKPLADLELFSLMEEPLPSPRDRSKPDLNAGTVPRGLRTDKEGKFRLEGLAPGLTYRIALFKANYLLQPEGDVGKGVTVKAGETKDLGELKIKPFDE